VRLGVDGAARVACVVMLAPQVVVIGLMVLWGSPLHAAAILALCVGQVLMMRRFLAAPVAQALWYSGFGVPLFVLGMMVSAFALRGALGA
jgi:chlorophyll/bacteriochlorophyll a synthase